METHAIIEIARCDDQIVEDALYFRHQIGNHRLLGGSRTEILIPFQQRLEYAKKFTILIYFRVHNFQLCQLPNVETHRSQCRIIRCCVSHFRKQYFGECLIEWMPWHKHFLECCSHATNVWPIANISTANHFPFGIFNIIHKTKRVKIEGDLNKFFGWDFKSRMWRRQKNQ